MAGINTNMPPAPCRAIRPAANAGLQHQVGIPTGPGPDDLGVPPWKPSSSYAGRRMQQYMHI